jgi:formylglycine-generating enzyme required for sulfatase activity
VSWDDAQDYVKWVSAKTGKTYRLLSEAEWEYVARAGSATAYWWGQDVGSNKANCSGCGSQWDGQRTAPVGSFDPNAFGLHDTAGNVWEWTEDCWHKSYRGAPEDGSAWATNEDCGQRVRRSGAYGLDPSTLRSADRFRLHPANRYDDVGFRVARTID